MPSDYVERYADEVSTFLVQQGFEYIQPDPQGYKFNGGVLLDLGVGRRLAFLMPGRNQEVTMKNLKAHLDEFYPGASIGPVARVGPVTYADVAVNEVPLDGAA